MTTRTITISDADLAALSAIRPVVADAHQHPGQAAALAALDRIVAQTEQAQALLHPCHGAGTELQCLAQVPEGEFRCSGCKRVILERYAPLGVASLFGKGLHEVAAELGVRLSDWPSPPTTTSTCPCRGCRTFHLGAAPSEGQDAHHTRLLLALDLSLAAACRSRAVPACNGQDGDDAHATDSCDIGTLHTRAGELAVELAAAIEEPSSTRQAERAGEALESLLAELRRVFGDRPRVS